MTLITRLFLLKKGFSLILLVFLACACGVINYFSAQQAGSLIISGPIVGFLEDYAHYAMIASTAPTLWALAYLQNALDQVFENKPALSRDDATNQNIAEMRKVAFGANGTGVRRFALCFIIMFGAFVFFSFVQPLLKIGMKSWALMPYEYPLSWASATLGSFLVFVVILSNVIWYGSIVTIRLFHQIGTIAKDDTALLRVPANQFNDNIERIMKVISALMVLVTAVSVFPLFLFVIHEGGILEYAVLGLYAIVTLIVFAISIRVLQRYIRSGKNRIISQLQQMYSEELHDLVNEKLRRPTKGKKKVDMIEVTHGKISFLANIDRVFERVDSISIYSTSFWVLARAVLVPFVPLLVAAVEPIVRVGVVPQILALFR